MSLRRRLFLVGGICLPFLLSIVFLSEAEDISFRHIIIDDDGPADMHTKSAGDINGDGFIDLIVAGTKGILLWYEYPNWTKHIVTTESGWSTDAEVGDIDRDGDQDIVISDWYKKNQMVWFENPGTDGDTWALHIIGSPRAHDIEISDLDGDTDLDVVTRQQGGAGNRIEIWMQNGLDSWTHHSIACPTGEGLHLGDIDKDGDADIIIGGRWYENTTALSNGDWTEHIFTHEYNHAETFPWMADMDQDGCPDLVLAPTEYKGGSYRISWFEAPDDPKSGDWSEHIIDSPVETVVHSLGVADMDNDEDLDVATAEMHQGSDPDEVRVHINEDGAGMTWSKQVIATTGSHNIRVIDIGSDGDYDIFGANYVGTQVDLWVNLSKLSLDRWTYIQLDNERSERAFGLAMGDLTGDGFSDIASGGYFYRNPGADMSGSWKRVTFPVENADALLTLDVDGDSRGDVIAMDSEGKIYWLEAEDDSGNDWSALQVGDLGGADHNISSQGYALGKLVEGDRQEIIINISSGMYYFEIPDNPEAENWPRSTITSTVYPEGISIGDVDRDGDVDVCGTVDNRKVAWWENRGDRKGEWVGHEIGSMPSRYADRFYMADLNGNSRLDVVVSVANGSANGIYWFDAPEDPKSSNWVRNTVVEQDTTNSMDVRDMDNDGDIDIISGEHRGAKKLSVWENDGNGNFIERVIDTGKESHLGARVADLDNDGDLDIVSICWDDYKYLHLWRNDNYPIPAADVEIPSAPQRLSIPTASPPEEQVGMLIAHWTFDDNEGMIAGDSSGNGHAGTLRNSPVWTDGRFGGTLLFDGTDDYVDLDGIDIVGPGLTIAAWIKASSFLPDWADNRIISRATGTGEQDHYWMLSTINSGGVKLRFRLKTNGVTNTLIAHSGNIATDTWIHVAATYDGSQMKLYKDGMVVGGMSKSGSLPMSSSVETCIGRNPDGYGYFHGLIDDVRIYNYALRQIEIQKLIR